MLDKKYLKPFNYMQKMYASLFKNVIYKMGLQIIFIQYICINMILALTYKHWYTIKPKQTIICLLATNWLLSP